MAECLECNLCDNPGTFAGATDVASIPCHVDCFRNDHFTVWRCTNCGSLHSKEEVDLLHYYDRYPFKNHRLDFHTRVGYANRIRLLERFGLKKTDRILDFGCGAGLFLQVLRSAGYTNVFGFDSFVQQFNDPGIFSQTFDAVVSYDVIEHVDSPREFLNMLVGRVRPGGLMVLGTPNADHIPLQYRTFPAMELSQPYHRHILSGRVLFELAREHSLEVQHTLRRFYFDSLIPTVNTRYMWSYINATGGMIDVCVQPMQKSVMFRSPRLLFEAFFGYFFPPRGNILVTFRRPLSEKLSGEEPRRRAGNE
ncbi:MAG: class I SAM-dependent methyltransferase [Bdellovibrionota bacterium]